MPLLLKIFYGSTIFEPNAVFDVISMVPTIALVAVYITTARDRVLAGVLGLLCVVCVWITLPVVYVNPPIWHSVAATIISMGLLRGLPGAVCVLLILGTADYFSTQSKRTTTKQKEAKGPRGTNTPSV